MASLVNPLFKPISVFIAAAILAACSQNPHHLAAPAGMADLATANLPPAAAEYKTTLTADTAGHQHDSSDAAAAAVVWRFWRDGRQIVMERPQLGLGELWQRDGKALIHRKLYHNDRRAIEFQEDDLKMLGNKPAWQKLALLVDPAVLARLAVGGEEWLDGKPVREYRGTAAGAEWHVVIRLDLGLPVLIERTADGTAEHTELLNAYPLSGAPWQPTASETYEIIDYADLGDKEYDPFVIKVQRQMGHEHHH
ncbi:MULTISPECIES: hypothetical protein [Methylomonas]|uniref:Outer-membrane lipoprotein LolB n=1 Tax=Methylomonas koyamae TaxID=702114 RepID=A0AA91I718_9GAMM|nr:MULTISPECIES: hypothetical protein [Methylomonas]OAI27806.1 hypothetical protein A1356_08940 [Methylomonas koyamae]